MATQASNVFSKLNTKAPQYGIMRPLLIIQVQIVTQTLSLQNSIGEILMAYPVSTSQHGLGNEIDSGNTPLGLHGVVERYGANQPHGTRFSSRRVLQETWNGTATEQDLITSRILRLAGLESLINRNSYLRYIYIHGTPHENEIGTPTSGGCIRMTNSDVMDLFDRCAEHDVLCWIE